MVPDPLADDYDESVLRRLDGLPRAARPAARAGGARRAIGATAVLTAVGLGLQDVLGPAAGEPIVVEVEPTGPDHGAPVDYLHVPGAPRLSRARVRPWLL